MSFGPSFCPICHKMLEGWCSTYKGVAYCDNCFKLKMNEHAAAEAAEREEERHRRKLEYEAEEARQNAQKARDAQ